MSSPWDPAADARPTPEPLRLVSGQLISIADIRAVFKLGRTAAYDLTHRPGFPDPVQVSPRCYRWLASEVDAFAATLPRQRTQRAPQRTARPRHSAADAAPRRITGTVRPARASKKEAS